MNSYLDLLILKIQNIKGNKTEAAKIQYAMTGVFASIIGKISSGSEAV